MTEGDALAEKRAAHAAKQPMLVHFVTLAANAVYDPAYAVYDPLNMHDSASALYDVAAAFDPGLHPAFARARLSQ